MNTNLNKYLYGSTKVIFIRAFVFFRYCSSIVENYNNLNFSIPSILHRSRSKNKGIKACSSPRKSASFISVNPRHLRRGLSLLTTLVLLLLQLSSFSIPNIAVATPSYSNISSPIHQNSNPTVSQSSQNTSQSPSSLLDSFSNQPIYRPLGFPPNPPIILWPVDGEQAGSITDFSGQAEAGSLIKITLNNNSQLVYSGTTRNDGFWDVLRVPLSPTGIDGIGKNLIRAIATNPYGDSEPTIIYAYYNSVPNANFVFPIGGEKLNGNQNVTITFSDEERNNLYYALYYSKGGNPWEYLYSNNIYYDPGIPGYPTEIYSWNTTSLNDGNNYTLIIEVSDDYGYPDPIVTGNFTIDNTGPYPTINPPLSTPIANNYTFTGNASDGFSNITSVEWRVDAGGWNSATITDGAGTKNANYQFQISQPNGNYTFDVRATDELGNITDVGDYATISVDVGTGSGIPASPLVTSPINNSVTGNSKITVSGLAEPFSTVKLYVNSPSSGIPVAQVQAAANATYTFNNVTLTPGLNTLITTATNGYGTSSDSTTKNVRHDNLAVSFSYYSGNLWQGTKSLSWGSTGLYSGSSKYTLDYSTNNGQTWTRILSETTALGYNWDTNSVADGMYYKVRVIANDGYLSVIKSTSTFTINNHLPTITLYPLSPDPINDITPTLSGVAYAANGVSGVEYTLDNGATWHPGSPQDGAFNSNYEQYILTTYSLGLDTYTIKVRAKDNLNCYTDSANYASDTFTTYDNAPTVSVITPKSGDAWGQTHNISWTASDIDDNYLTYSIQYLKDGGTTTIVDGLTSTNYNWNTSDVYDGFYQIKVIAWDGILNGEGTSQNFIIDHTSPSIAIDQPVKNPTNETNITFTGNSNDNLSGIQDIEYQINNGEWYKAIIISGYNSNYVTYRFKYPFPLKEGENVIKTRATDRAENIGYSDVLIITIDTTPPMIGSMLIKDGVFILLPDIYGKTYISTGTIFNFSVYVTFEPKIVKAKIGDKFFDLTYSKSTGLYFGKITINSAGKFSLNVYAEDSVGNSKIRELAQLEVGESGLVLDSKDRGPLSDTKITVYFFEESEKRWVVWDGSAYGQTNPILTKEDGRFSITLSSGRFYFTVEKDGYISYKSNPFVVEKTKLLNNVIILKKDVIQIVLPTNKFGLPTIVLGSRQISGILVILFFSFIFFAVKKPVYNFLRGF